MTVKPKQVRSGGSVLSLRKVVPDGWRDEPPAFVGDPFFDWESRPEPPRPDRQIRFGIPQAKRPRT
ncbi:MAG: hypothetical protein LOD90_11435 [Symbiobacteriaceae bacterium]